MDRGLGASGVNGISPDNSWLYSLGVSIQSANTTEDNTDTNTDEWPFELMPQV
jgi:hypothetical protein